MALDKATIRGDLSSTVLMLGGWAAWLAFISVAPLPHWLSLPMTSFVLVFGSLQWTYFFGAFAVLLMVWIHHAFSIAPPGLLWVIYFSAFIALKVIMTQFSLTGISQLFLALFSASLLMDIFQLILMNRSFESAYLTASLFGVIFVSAFVQALMGIPFTEFILSRARVE